MYVGVVKDPEFVYSGEPEGWRDNIDLVEDLGTGAGPLAGFASSDEARQVDWATFILPETYDQLPEWVGPAREVDVSAWRPFMPGKSDAEIREKMNFEPRAKIERLPPDRSYVLVSVEGL